MVGENLAICGKTSGGKYYGSFGESNYETFKIYQGRQIPAQNIKLFNLTFTTKSSNISKQANNIGVFNSNNVLFSNCTFENAPQSNVVVVNDTKKSKNGMVKFLNCSFLNSGAHNFRAVSYNQGAIIGNEVTLDNCVFSNVLSSDKITKEILNKKVNIWYRAGVGGKNIYLNVNNCNIDKSGVIMSTANSNGLNINSSHIHSSINLSTGSNYINTSNVRITNNKFFNSSLNEKSLNKAVKDNPYIQVNGGSELNLKGNSFPNSKSANNVRINNVRKVLNN